MVRVPQKVQEKIIDGISPQHRGIARAYFHGSSPEQIAEDLSFSIPQVKLVLSNVATYIEGAPKPKTKTKSKGKKLDTLRKAFKELDQRDAPSKELEDLLPRALEIIASVLNSDKLSARQIDTAFKVLNRTGLHEKKEELGGNKSLTFVSYAPLPGDDPAKALKRAKEIEDKKE